MAMEKRQASMNLMPCSEKLCFTWGFAWSQTWSSLIAANWSIQYSRTSSRILSMTSTASFVSQIRTLRRTLPISCKPNSCSKWLDSRLFCWSLIKSLDSPNSSNRRTTLCFWRSDPTRVICSTCAGYCRIWSTRRVWFRWPAKYNWARTRDKDLKSPSRKGDKISQPAKTTLIDVNN